MFNPVQIATKRTPPRKGATRRSPAPRKRKTAWWLWLLVPGIVIAFIFGLMQLNQVSPEAKPAASQPAKVTPKPVAPAPAKKPVEVAPKAEVAPKKDTFEFYQILQDSKVDTSHVDAYQSTPRGEQDYYYMLQAASFRNPEDADRMRAQLILSGLVETSVRETTGQNEKPWFRVILGPYDSRSKMKRAEDRLVSMNISPYSYKVDKEQ